MRTVWKYRLFGLYSQSLLMPKGAEILFVRSEGDGATLWALVDTTAPTVHRQFVFLLTGWEVPDASVAPCTSETYLTTLIEHDQTVHHLFDCGER